MNTKKQLVLPDKALSDKELLVYAKCLAIPYFRGVFMRDALPTYPWDLECAIVNLDDTNGSGTHWVCYKKIYSTVFYYDSLGNIPPPMELLAYFKHVGNILYNYDRQQADDTNICGHLCLEFLSSDVSSL